MQLNHDSHPQCVPLPVTLHMEFMSHMGKHTFLDMHR